MTYSNKSGPVTVKDLVTGEVKRTDKALTDKEVKAIINKGMPHKRSIVMLIKDDPKLLALYQTNRTKYLEDYEAQQAQFNRGINTASMAEEKDPTD